MTDDHKLLVAALAVAVLLLAVVLRPRRRRAPVPGWRGLLERPDVLVVDTETTGLGARAEVVEIVAMDTTGAVRFEALAMPAGDMPKAASDVHGLTRDTLRAGGARPWPEVWADLAPVLASAAVVLAWNADFDRRMLAQTNGRHGLAAPALPWRDLLADYRLLRPGQRAGLQAAVAREGATAGVAHRARGDCESVLAVMRVVAMAP